MRLFSRKAPPAAHSEPQKKVQVRKWDLVWRALAFIILELAFLALATLCLITPIPLLPASASSRTLVVARAVTTVIAVTWHTIALFPIKDIISTVFSAECIAQYRRTGRLQPNVTDRVSCITSGLLAQVSHFLTLQPTLEYRLTFLLVLSNMALVPLGPSVIGLSPSLITHQEDLQIANLTMSKDVLLASQYQWITKADEIVYLEAIEGVTYGYRTQTAQTLIPWPNTGFGGNQTVIKYESDVVVYDYICQWPKFKIDFASQVIITDMANISWAPWIGYSPDFAGSSEFIMPMLGLRDDNSLSVSAFAFVYDDPKTYDPLGNIQTWILPSGPTTVNPTTVDNEPSSETITNTTGLFGPGMAAILLCDPHYTISRAEVTLQNGQLNAILVERPLLGNFPESTANSLFSQVFLNTFSPDVGISSHGVFPFTGDNNKTILALSEINNNMNRIIQSAAKAYISGYIGSQLGIFPNYTTFNQTATVQYPEVSLVSSRQFLVALWVLDGVIIVILAILLCIINTKETLLFNLQTMETIYMVSPTGNDNLASPQPHPRGPYAIKLEFTWRVIAFVILEFSFLVFVGSCLANPIPVHLPSFISSSQAKTATTAIVVAWRTLAVFPMKDIISLVFSAECIAQYRRTGHLEPDTTDRVSHATSGFMDQISHFILGYPTLGFRLAFLLVLFVALIGPLGPGVVTLTELPTTCPQYLLVANISSQQATFEPANLQVDGRSQIAQSFVELELLEGKVYGYNTVADEVLIPWPELGVGQSENVTMYESDVAVFNYSCHWAPVEPPDDEVIFIPSVSNETYWEVWSNGMGRSLPKTEGIFPLVASTQSPLSAVVFTANSTVMDLASTGTSILYTPGISSSMTLSLSVLLCDPQYKIQRANVRVSSGKLSANTLPALPLLGNFPENSASLLFSQALVTTLAEAAPNHLLKPISMLLFTGELNGSGPLQPHPLPVINDNINQAFKSAAKAYLSGNNTSEESIASGYTPWNQTATLQYQQLMLVASRPFFIGLLVLVAVTVVILVVLLKVVDIGNVQLFNLQTFKMVYTDKMLSRDD